MDNFSSEYPFTVFFPEWEIFPLKILLHDFPPKCLILKRIRPHLLIFARNGKFSNKTRNFRDLRKIENYTTIQAFSAGLL